MIDSRFSQDLGSGLTLMISKSTSGWSHWWEFNYTECHDAIVFLQHSNEVVLCNSYAR